MIRHNRNMLMLGSLAAVTSPLAAQSVPDEGTAKQPNIVMILADDIGFGDLSCNVSNPVVATPNVDRLAARGIRFTDAHATAATSTPSRYSILTGEYAWRRPGTGVAPGDAAMIVTPEHSTLPAMLQQAGYTTAAIGKWHLGLGSERGRQQWNSLISPALVDIGFNYSYIMAATADRVPCVYIENGRVANYDPTAPIEVSYGAPIPGEPTGASNPEMLHLHPSHGHDQAIVNGISRIGHMKGGGSALWVDQDIADTITSRALSFIEREAHTPNPFFLYFCTNDIHVPRDPHPRFVGRSGLGARGDAILQFDWSVGQVLDMLDSLGIADNTLVILTSDNGPVVDDGYADRAVELLGEHRPWGEWRGGKYSNFEAGTRVPFIVRWPSAVTTPSVSAAPVSQVDLFASLATLAGASLADGVAPDSYNNLPALLGRESAGRPYIVESAGSLSVAAAGWKYIAPSGGAAIDRYTNTELGNSAQAQLYNLAEDPAEKNNVASKNPERVREMAALLEKIKTTPDR